MIVLQCEICGYLYEGTNPPIMHNDARITAEMAIRDGAKYKMCNGNCIDRRSGIDRRN